MKLLQLDKGMYNKEELKVIELADGSLLYIPIQLYEVIKAVFLECGNRKED